MLDFARKGPRSARAAAAAIRILALSILTVPASGQQGENEQPPVDDRCGVVPDDENSPDAQRQTNGAEKSLSEVLEDCNGVLDPPPVGDSEIVEPPPDTGETPVIRPDDLPAQQDPE